VAPSSVYAVVNGVATHLNLNAIPQVTPRMLNLLSNSSMAGAHGRAPTPEAVTTYTSGTSSTLQAMPSQYMFQRLISRQRTSSLTAGNGYGNGYHGSDH